MLSNTELDAILKGVAVVINDRLSSIPTPLKGDPGKDAEVTEEQVAKAVTGYLAEHPIPVPSDGKDVDPEQVATLVVEHVSKAVEKLPKPIDGKDGRNAFDVAVSLGFDGDVYKWQESLRGEKGADGKSVTSADLAKAIEALPIPQNGKDGKDGSDGTDGKDGVNGTSVTVEQVLPELHSQLAKAVAEIPVPKDGKDGTDGKSITIDDVRPMMEQALAVWELDFERRATDLIQRCIDRIEKPKDGTPGKDGRDGFDVQDMDVLYDGERTITIKFVRGDLVKEFPFKLPVPIYCGVWKTGQKYERGDSVSFGGSIFIAQRDTESKPETDDSFRLSVKRGRDGRDGKNGQRGDQGPAGKDFRTTY